MTTKNLADNSPLVAAAIAEMQAIEERAAAVAKEADELEKQRQETESQRDKALRALEISARRVRQQAQDNLVELDEQKDILEEEADQLLYILEGDSDDEPVAPAPEPEPEPAPAPVAPAPDPEPVPAAPTLMDDLADHDETDQQLTVLTRANPRNWGWISWVLAILLAIIAYKIGGHVLHGIDKHGFGKALVWVSMRLLAPIVGFFTGGFIGSHIQDYLDRRRATRVVAVV